MICQNCKQETEEGKFCTNCGAELIVDDRAATLEANAEETVESETTEQTAPVQAEQAVQ